MILTALSCLCYQSLNEFATDLANDFRTVCTCANTVSTLSAVGVAACLSMSQYCTKVCQRV